MRRALAVSLLGILLFAFAAAGLASAAETRPTATIGQKEGNPAAAACPAGTYLAGLTLWVPTISGVSPYCAAMAPDGRWQAGAQIHLDAQMSAGVPGDEKQMNLFCPMNFFASGFSGYSQVYGIHGLTQLTITCRNLQTGASMTLSTPLNAGVAQTQWPGARCPDDSAAVGVFGTAYDNEVIQLGFTCGVTQPAALQTKLLKHPDAVSATTPFGRASPGVLAPRGTVSPTPGSVASGAAASAAPAGVNPNSAVRATPGVVSPGGATSAINCLPRCASTSPAAAPSPYPAGALGGQSGARAAAPYVPGKAP